MKTTRPTTPIWEEFDVLPEIKPLDVNVTCDVAVIGAGIAGVSTAYMLAREGVQVLLVDDGRIGGGETIRTTAHITCALDVPFTELERMHGLDRMRDVVRSLRTAIDVFEENVAVEKVDCDFKRLDAYIFQGKETEKDELLNELDAMQRLGLLDVECLDRTPSILKNGACIKVPHQAQIQISSYLAALTASIVRLGGQIYCNTHIRSITDGDPAELTTDTGNTIRAKHVVVCTNSPISNAIAIHTKLAAYRSYVIAAELISNDFLPGLYWDTEEPYHYFRTQRLGSKEMLIIGGNDHKTGQASDFEQRYNDLEMWARENLPRLGPVEYRWSGQVYEPVDGLAYIGRDPGHESNVYVAAGFSGVGMAQGTLAGLILSDLIMQRPNEWSDIYDPSRKVLAAAGRYLKENVNSVAQYADYLKPDDSCCVEDIPAGEGAILQSGMKKVAVYKDEAARVFTCSAICPHLKGIVTWNTSEKSWDCPAHGSRFTATGEVIDGPANCNLESAELSSDATTMPIFDITSTPQPES